MTVVPDTPEGWAAAGAANDAARECRRVVEHAMTDEEYAAMRAACPFCDYAGPSPVLYEDKVVGAFVIEPLDPCTPGHVIVVSLYHVPDFADDDAFCGEVMEVAARYVRESGMGDCNLITSRGAAATQSVKHLHVHLVPRSPGDGLKLPWSAQAKKGPPTHICNACGKRIEYGAHAHGCEP